MMLVDISSNVSRYNFDITARLLRFDDNKKGRQSSEIFVIVNTRMRLELSP